jgi:hypothetical protein
LELFLNSSDDFFVKLMQTRDFGHAFELFNQRVKELGFQGSLYSFIPGVFVENELPQTPVIAASKSYIPDYLDAYQQERFDQKDNILHAVLQGEKRILDWGNEIKTGKVDQDGKEVIEIARFDYGAVNGFTIPIQTLPRGRGVSCASFISSERGNSYKQLKQERLDELVMLTRFFNMLVLDQGYEFRHFIMPLLGEVSFTEFKVLYYLAQGMKASEIATAVGLSTRYTENVIRHARIKMGGLSDNDKPRMPTTRLAYHLGSMHLPDRLDENVNNEKKNDNSDDSNETNGL